MKRQVTDIAACPTAELLQETVHPMVQLAQRTPTGPLLLHTPHPVMAAPTRATAPPLRNKKTNIGGAPVHWEYDGDLGPSHWGDLADKFIACKSGASQSPINISNVIDPSPRRSNSTTTVFPCES